VIIIQQYGGSGGAGYQPYGGQPPAQAPPPAPPPPPPMTGKSKIPLLVIVFAILAVIFMGISLALPWYQYTYDGEWTTHESFGGLTFNLDGKEETESWDDLEGVDATKNLYNITMILTILGLIFAILLLIGAALTIKGKGRNIAVTFGLLTFIFCLLSPIVFLAMHPGALDEDWDTDDDTGAHKSFMGSEEKSGWGPGIGWILAFIGFIFAILGFMFALKLPKPAAREYMRPPPGPSYGQPPPPQQQQHYPGYGTPPQAPPQQPPQYPGY
jgi:amino acid transporter